jgi:hypothetical protein
MVVLCCAMLCRVTVATTWLPTSLPLTPWRTVGAAMHHWRRWSGCWCNRLVWALQVQSYCKFEYSTVQYSAVEGIKTNSADLQYFCVEQIHLLYTEIHTRSIRPRGHLHHPLDVHTTIVEGPDTHGSEHACVRMNSLCQHTNRCQHARAVLYTDTRPLALLCCLAELVSPIKSSQHRFRADR